MDASASRPSSQMRKVFEGKDASASRLHSWLSAAVKHNVQELIFCLPKEREFAVPSSLLTSVSLRSFWLKMHCTLKLPSFICFSSLKDLNLYGVMFQDDQCVQQIFSGFPVLEDLTLYNCDWENIKEITIEIPTLRSLTFSEKVFLDDNFLICKIIISAVNLETLDVYSCLKVELLPCNLLSLNEASINVDNWINGKQEYSHRLVKLLCGLHNVKSLKLSNKALESLLFAESIEGHLPTFYNLTMLNASVNGPYIDDDYTSGALMFMLHKSPNVKSLILSRGFKPEDEGMVMDIVPGCFQSCLKSVVIFNVGGGAAELCFLKYLYENAPVLERLSISCTSDLSIDFDKQEETVINYNNFVEAQEAVVQSFHPYGSLNACDC
ncbi:hypothetical protein CRYUN_Cryun41cG0047500 [Craigia yunnanensis]